MTEPINWPSAEFTLEELVSLNPQFKESDVRKALARQMEAKAVTQTLKGNGKVKGKFQVIKKA